MKQFISSKRFLTYGMLGILLILLEEWAIIVGFSPLTPWVTPVCWWGYILLVDNIILLRKGKSLITSRTREFILMIPLSVGFWLIFEAYNLILHNWIYIGLIRNLFLRNLGYFLAFSSILPAILLTAELVEDIPILSHKFKEHSFSRKWLVFEMLLGAFFLVMVMPLVKKPSTAMAPLVWLGFIFLLEPANKMLGAPSVIADIERGSRKKFLSLILSGFICGFLWEFWNYWAATKWYYTVPFLPHIKIFEMPILGYFGFPPFALELYAMYNFTMYFLRKLPFFKNS